MTQLSIDVRNFAIAKLTYIIPHFVDIINKSKRSPHGDRSIFSAKPGVSPKAHPHGFTLAGADERWCFSLTFCKGSLQSSLPVGSVAEPEERDDSKTDE